MKRLEPILAGLSDYRPDDLPLEQALAIIRAVVTPIEKSETLPLRAALGRVLARGIVSPIDVPGHESSAMDGWAVRGADLGDGQEIRLREVGSAFAGHPFKGRLGPGECVRIMTGAVMPQGADTVVMQEVVHLREGAVVIPPGQRAGSNRRFAGEDIAKGCAALSPGTTITPAAVGLAASLGITEVEVRARPRVAFFSSGDELTMLGEPLGAGQVYDSNRHALWAMLERLGCETRDLGVVGDDPGALEAALREGAAWAEAIVTTGGASEGEADFTRRIAAGLGEVAFWKLAARPGRPFAFGTISASGRDALFFGLPGNPVAAMVCFYRMVRPALLQMTGARNTEPVTVRVKAAEPMRKRIGREEAMRGVITRDASGECVVRLTGAQGSAMMTSVCEANCLVVLARQIGAVAAGDWVDAIVLEGLV